MAQAFIALEGIHGAGKTNLANLLIAELSDAGIAITFSKDQAGTVFSQTIRDMNLDEESKVDACTETFLVAAARRQTFVEVIVPALQQGQSVITERFVDSFAAYGHARHLSLSLLEEISHATCEGRLPDFTLLLDLDPEVGMQRIAAQKKHRIEMEGLEFHRRLRQGYLEQAKRNPSRYLILDASAPMDVVLSRALGGVEAATGLGG